MSQSESPLNRLIGLSGVVRWLIAVIAMVTIGAAFADHHYVLGVVGALFMVGAVGLGVWAWRARQAVDEGTPPDMEL